MYVTRVVVAADEGDVAGDVDAADAMSESVTVLTYAPDEDDPAGGQGPETVISVESAVYMQQQQASAAPYPLSTHSLPTWRLPFCSLLILTSLHPNRANLPQTTFLSSHPSHPCYPSIHLLTPSRLKYLIPPPPSTLIYPYLPCCPTFPLFPNLPGGRLAPRAAGAPCPCSR
jgi:hypothetical protein